MSRIGQSSATSICRTAVIPLMASTCPTSTNDMAIGFGLTGEGVAKTPTGLIRHDDSPGATPPPPPAEGSTRDAPEAIMRGGSGRSCRFPTKSMSV